MRGMRCINSDKTFVEGWTIFYKIHVIQQQKILAACDKELSGKIIDKKINFEVKPEFYGTKEINEKKLRKLLHEVNSANLTGNKSVSAALKENLIEEKNIIKINKISHIQVYFIKGA